MDWTHRLRLRNLKMLLSLDQTRNISHSAAMLNTTQPGLSKWLKDLKTISACRCSSGTRAGCGPRRMATC